MIEKDIITRRLTALDDYLQDLEEIKKEHNLQSFLGNKVIRRYTERTLHLAIENCLDLANHIISYEGFREPENNQDVFQILLEERIIVKELENSLKKMAQFRNIIVHDYLKIKPEIVFAILTKHSKDLSRFAIQIKNNFLKD